MKQTAIISLVLLALVFALPVLTVGGAPPESGILDRAATEPPGSQSPVPESGSGGSDFKDDSTSVVKVKMPDGVREMSMREYLYGVVSAEMPAEFPLEALKAQAVAARTLTVNRILLNREGKSDPVHEGADVCTEYAHCEAWASPEQNKERWGSGYDEYMSKIQESVDSTNAMLVLYGGEPILAAFHAASSGRTERSADVWGGDVPYLVSVESPGESDSPRYYGRLDLTPEDFKAEIHKKYPAAALAGDPAAWVQAENRSPSGGVIDIKVGGITISGNDLRKMFSLNSTNFTVAYEDRLLVFRTIGYGHGVGMSQYGARALAMSGKNFEDILKWYYVGTSVGGFGASASAA